MTTIGVRLTLSGTLITLSVCAAVCVLLYAGVSVSLHAEVDAFLEGEVQEFQAILRAAPGADLREVEQEIRMEVGSRVRGDLAFRLLDAEGRLLVTSSHDELQPTPRVIPQPSTNTAGTPWFETLTLIGSRKSVRVCSEWAQLSDGRWCILQVTYALDRLDASLATFRWVCVAAMLVAAVLSLIGSHLLARRSLRPVHEMTESARRLGASRLAGRLPRSHNQDELDRLAETLNEMLSRIERQLHQMQQFTADASHELRTPLAALRGKAEVALTSKQGGDALRQVVEESVEQYDRLSRIADDMLLLARLDAGQTILRCEPVHLDKTVQDIVDLYSPYAAEHHIELTLGNCEPVTVRADEERLRQVLSNMIDNSIKYMDGPGRIDVSLICADGHASITVTDTGPGIPEDDLPRVFDRFYRVDRARSRRGERGAGLGLPICRSIAEAHGGRIDIQSRSGQGTAVKILLPLATAEV